ncbi:MAG: hypothetical protein ACAI44_06550, partial [Candidatus Sericytochromatia bacterium]
MTLRLHASGIFVTGSLLMASPALAHPPGLNPPNLVESSTSFRLAQATTPGSGAGTLTQDNTMTSQSNISTPGSGTSANSPLGSTEMQDYSAPVNPYGDDYDTGSGSWSQDYLPNIGSTVPDLDLAASEPRQESGTSQAGQIFSDPFGTSDANDSDNNSLPSPIYLILFGVLAAALVLIIVMTLKNRNAANQF